MVPKSALNATESFVKVHPELKMFLFGHTHYNYQAKFHGVRSVSVGNAPSVVLVYKHNKIHAVQLKVVGHDDEVILVH